MKRLNMRSIFSLLTFGLMAGLSSQVMAYQTSLTCESHDFQPASCYVGENIRYISNVHQHSSADCVGERNYPTPAHAVHGHSFGFEYNRIWVDSGCRATFTVEVGTYIPPYPPNPPVTHTPALGQYICSQNGVDLYVDGLATGTPYRVVAVSYEAFQWVMAGFSPEGSYWSYDPSDYVGIQPGTQVVQHQGRYYWVLTPHFDYAAIPGGPYAAKVDFIINATGNYAHGGQVRASCNL